MRLYNCIGMVVCFLYAGLVFFFPESGLAATIGSQLNTISTEVNTTWFPALKIFFFLIGIVILGMGFMKFLSARGGQGSVGEAFKYLTIGACLTAITAVSMMVGGTVAGESSLNNSGASWQ